MKETKNKRKKKEKNNNSTLLKLTSYNPKRITSKGRKKLLKILKTAEKAKKEACQKG